MSTVKLSWRIIFLSSLGGALELYDFMIFAFFAPTLGRLFFPSQDPIASVLGVFIVFAIGYLVRPIGGMICGHLGDQHGRKKIFVATVIAMAIPTALMGLLPSYHQIGVSATILLCILRILQGLAMGGEIPGSIIFIAESTYAKPGLASGIILFFLNMGMLTGSLSSTVLNHLLSQTQLDQWGFRLPFLFGGLLGVLCYYLRKQLQETPLFEKLLTSNKKRKHPLLEVMRTHYRQVLQGIAMAGFSAAFFAFYFYMPTYFHLLLHYPKERIMTINTLSIFVFSCSSLLMCFLSDYLNRRIIITAGCIGFLLFSIPIYHLFQGGASDASIMVGEFSLSILGGLITSVFPYLLAELFPTPVRYSGYASAYNVSFAVIGGLTPSLVTFLVARAQNFMIPAYYLMITAAVCLLAVLSIKRFYLTEEKVNNTVPNKENLASY